MQSQYRVQIIVKNITKHSIPKTHFKGESYPRYGMHGVRINGEDHSMNCRNDEWVIDFTKQLTAEEIQKMDISINITEYTPYESNNFLMDNTGKITREIRLKGVFASIACEMESEILPKLTEKENGYKLIIDMQTREVFMPIKIVPAEIQPQAQKGFKTFAEIMAQQANEKYRNVRKF